MPFNLNQMLDLVRSSKNKHKIKSKQSPYTDHSQVRILLKKIQNALVIFNIIIGDLSILKAIVVIRNPSEYDLVLTMLLHSCY